MNYECHARFKEPDTSLKPAEMFAAHASHEPFVLEIIKCAIDMPEEQRGLAYGILQVIGLWTHNAVPRA